MSNAMRNRVCALAVAAMASLFAAPAWSEAEPFPVDCAQVASAPQRPCLYWMEPQ